MSSTILPPRAQLCNRSCSNKLTDRYPKRDTKTKPNYQNCRTGSKPRYSGTEPPLKQGRDFAGTNLYRPWPRQIPGWYRFVGDQNVTLKERRGAPKFLNRIRTSVRFLWRWRRTAVCECNVLVAQTLSYPTQLASHRHPPPCPNVTDTCVHCRASIFGALRLPSSTDWIFFGENRRRIDRDFKTFSSRHSVPCLGTLICTWDQGPSSPSFVWTRSRPESREGERERERASARAL